MKNVYTLADLESRELLDADADKPARLAVIGHPIAHSASPIMHQAALDARSIDARYIRIDLEPGRVVEALSKMRKLGFIGCNVTVPHKIEAMAACGEIDPAARKIGAVNTLRFNAGGVEGFNTDGPGFQRAVEEVFDNRLRDLRVMVVGAGGGAGQAIATQCALTGVPRLVLANIKNQINEDDKLGNVKREPQSKRLLKMGLEWFDSNSESAAISEEAKGQSNHRGPLLQEWRRRLESYHQ